MSTVRPVLHLGKQRHSKVIMANQDSRAYARMKIRMWETYRIFHPLNLYLKIVIGKEKKNNLYT